jgi:hypothetical protein
MILDFSLRTRLSAAPIVTLGESGEKKMLCDRRVCWFPLF